MKALVLGAPGEAPILTVQEIPTPVPGEGEALVRVAACGLCYHDIAVMRGILRRGVKPGTVLGHEVSGTVADVGPGVTSLKPGDGVVSMLTVSCGRCQRCAAGWEYRCLGGKGIGHALDGGLAEYLCLPERSLVALPQGIGLKEACVLACPLGVAVKALEDVARVQRGETVLVTGAGGGLGIHLVQVAAALGASVLAVTTSPEKVKSLEALGCCQVLLPEGVDFSELALALTDDQGVDVVTDTVGSATFRGCLASLAQGGRLVLLGEVTGGEVRTSLAEVLFRDASVLSSTGAERRHVVQAASLVRQGAVRPFISAEYSLESAMEAYYLMKEGKTLGRVAIVP